MQVLNEQSVFKILQTEQRNSQRSVENINLGLEWKQPKLFHFLTYEYK